MRQVFIEKSFNFSLIALMRVTNAMSIVLSLQMRLSSFDIDLTIWRSIINNERESEKLSLEMTKLARFTLDRGQNSLTSAFISSELWTCLLACLSVIYCWLSRSLSSPDCLALNRCVACIDNIEIATRLKLIVISPNLVWLRDIILSIITFFWAQLIFHLLIVDPNSQLIF